MDNDQGSYNLNRIIGVISGAIAIYFIFVLMGTEWAANIIVNIGIVPLEEVNAVFAIVPAAISSWCFSNAKKIKNKD